jgi:hypothetical protein
MRPNDKLLELEDDDVPPFDPEVERAFDAACLALSRACRREDKLLALRSGVEALKKFDDYGTAIRDLGARAVTYGMRLADIKSIVGQDFEDPPPHEISDELDELVDVGNDAGREQGGGHDLADAAPRQVEREVPAPSETAATARIEQVSPPPPPLVPTAPHDAAEQDHPPPEPIDIAIGFARYGWPVFPCDPRTKHPLTPRDKDPKTGEPIDGTGGFKKATTDIETIRARWIEHPNAMVGIPTGEIIGAFVLEIDIADKAGNVYTTVEAQIAAVEAELEVKLPPTYQVHTPRGGAHLFFRSEYGYPRSYASIKRAGKRLQGIDIRADGGYVISSGSIRYDGRAYVCVDKRKIAQAPIELVDWACGRGRWTPQEAAPPDSSTTTAAEKPSGATFGTRKAPRETCERWAAAALEGNAAELAAAKPGQRNTLANLLAYRSGRMVAPGWIPEQDVIDAYMTASQANGKIRDDGGPEKIRATIASGLDAGKRKPLRELPDRSRKPWQQIDGDDDNWFLRSLRSEMRALYRMRFPGNPAAIDDADLRLWEIIKVTFDPWKIGQELRLTFEEYKRLAREAHGRKKGPRLPAKMLPADVSREVVEAFRKDRQREQDRIYRTNKRAKEQAEQAAINDLDDKASAVLTFLQKHPRPQSVDDIYEGVRRSRAFKGMKPGSIKNAIRGLVNPPEGKLSPLPPLITVTKVTGKNQGPKILVEIRKNET